MDNLTRQEKTIIKCCIRCEILSIEQLNIKLEIENDGISAINYNHDNETILYLHTIIDKLGV